jgi:hypothetical protein
MLHIWTLMQEDRSEKPCNWGSTEGERSQKVDKKAVVSPKYGYFQISGLGHPLPCRSRFTAILSSIHPSTPMNSYATEPAPSHGDLLADRLRRLDNLDDQSVQASEQIHPTPVLPNKAPNPYDGYGFRPPSGMTPPRAPNSPLPDVNGLGWPGASSFFLVILFPLTPPPPRPAKATLSRLNASPAENATRQTRLAGAVRTVLECIGEDPDREGLLRTPERYAQALMWMTKGYEERLAGRFFMHAHPTPPFFFSRVHALPPQRLKGNLDPRRRDQ